MKLSDITGVQPDTRTNKPDARLVDSDVYVGVELEIQNVRDYGLCPLPEHSFWHTKEDGSLRDCGMEFVTGVGLGGHNIAPIRGADLTGSLDIWKEWVLKYEKATGNKLSVPERTAAHIHIDVRALDKEDLDRLSLLWATFEPTFFELVGNGRQNNIHCKPFFKNVQAKRRAGQILHTTSGPELNKLYHGASKYEAMNILSVTTFGSVEFRIHHGTINADEILGWINLLLMLRKAAMDKSISVNDMPEMASGNGMIGFVGQVFQEHSGVIMPIITTKLFYYGLRQAQEIIHSINLERLHKLYEKQLGGKDAGDESILHQWAAANNRQIY